MNFKHFSIEEREKIQEMIWNGQSIRAIARALGRSHTSVSREVRRHNPEQPKRYTPRKAHERALERRKSRGRKDRLKNGAIRTYVKTKLKERWSPEQIAGCIHRDIGETVSHEAIYQFVYAQVHRDGFGLLRPGAEDFRPYLRRKKKRRTHKGMRRSQRIFVSKGIPIDLRPSVVGERSRFGDWESDTVESRDHKPGVNTLLERKTGMYFVTRVRDKSAQATAEAIHSRMKAVPSFVRHTITFDNGSENSSWQEIEKELGIEAYFAHPYSSWERGSNENANGLLREYFPKGTDFADVSDAQLAAVEYALNTRPRKRLGWKTPLQMWSGAIEG